MPKRIVVVNFERYNPPHKAVNAEVREGGPLRWVRLTTDWYEDETVMGLPPEERYLWPFLLARAGRGNPRGTIGDSMPHLAHLAHSSESSLRHAIRYLEKSGRVATQEVTK